MTIIADRDVFCSQCYDSIKIGSRMKLVKNGDRNDIVCMRCSPAVTIGLATEKKGPQSHRFSQQRIRVGT